MKVVGDRLAEFDLLLAKGGRLVLCEVKDGSKPASGQKLKPSEEAFQAAMKLHGITVELLTCAEDIQVLERTVVRNARSYDDRTIGER